MQPRSGSPYSCNTLPFCRGWSIASALFSFNFISIACSSMKNHQQIFAVPLLFLSCLRPRLGTCLLGRLHSPLYSECACLTKLKDLLSKSLQPPSGFLSSDIYTHVLSFLVLSAFRLYMSLSTVLMLNTLHFGSCSSPDSDSQTSQSFPVALPQG